MLIFSFIDFKALLIIPKIICILMEKIKILNYLLRIS
tara:strand:- start:490 stop:600 length:111 start_codon:yes stop_codon:yes gene_type:complete